MVQDYLDTHRMKPADLARASGVSPQVLSKILTDTRAQLEQRPKQVTVERLARAMGVSVDYLLGKVAEAMGLPVAEVRVPDADAISDQDLLRVLADRLRRAEEVVGREHGSAPMTTDNQSSSRADSAGSAPDAEPEPEGGETSVHGQSQDTRALGIQYGRRGSRGSSPTTDRSKRKGKQHGTT